MYRQRREPNQNLRLQPGHHRITDHFFCFTCDEYVWDCDHLIHDRLSDPKVGALELSPLQSFAYDGKVRVREMGSGSQFIARHELPLSLPLKVTRFPKPVDERPYLWPGLTKLHINRIKDPSAPYAPSTLVYLPDTVARTGGVMGKTPWTRGAQNLDLQLHQGWCGWHGVEYTFHRR